MSTTVCVVGLGYVGLPLTYLLAQYASASIIGYDIDEGRVSQARAGIDHTNLVPESVVEKYAKKVTWATSLPAGADIYIVCVPTPDQNGSPDYSYVDSACDSVMCVIGKGGCLVLESTVAPGTMRDRIEPMLRHNGLTTEDVLLAYSPERINPGKFAYAEMVNSVKLVGVDDKEHEAFGLLLAVYSRTFRDVKVVNDTRVAELAKCFENFQRDMNIAMMNELSMHCHKHGISIQDVLAGLRTKPNSPVFFPGMVGGHCIPVDSHYLAEWYDPKRSGGDLPSLGRSVNERFTRYVFDLARAAKHEGTKRVLIVGETYKQDVADCRNSGTHKLRKMFEKQGIPCDIYDPLTGSISLPPGRTYNVLIAAVNHSSLGSINFVRSKFQLTIDCTAINVGGFTDYQLKGINSIINL